MPPVVDGAVPPQTKAWPFSPVPHQEFTVFPPSPPLEMSSDTLPMYMPTLPDATLPSQSTDMNPGLPSSGWYGPSVPAPDCSNETGYGQFGYNQPYVTPQTSSLNSYSPPTEFPKLETSVPYPKASSLTAFSPVSDAPPLEYSRISGGMFPTAPRTSDPPYIFGFVHMDQMLPARPRSSPSTFSPTNNPGGPIDYSWTLNPLGISNSQSHEPFYSNATYPAVRERTPRYSEPMTPVTEIAAPQPRRMYPPIAPNPSGMHSSLRKRTRDDLMDESPDASKRRKRSESTATLSMDLGEEDKLLVQLKDEENMPWKDIAAKFQSELGKTYQIPALQMRLKRLRERMRVWGEADVKALRLAHDYWVQSKFDIISQKMADYGAAERWSARQCARKWGEIDPGPTPYTTFDHSAPSYGNYVMSPVEAPPFLPYLQIPP